MSTFHPVRRAARRAFSPSLPIASASWSSGTMTVASLVSSSTKTSRTRAGESAFATKRAGSGFHGMMSIFSPRSSETTMRTREPRGPTHAPTGSTPCACDRLLAAAAHEIARAVDGLVVHHFSYRFGALMQDFLHSHALSRLSEVLLADGLALDLIPRGLRPVGV